MRGRELGCGPFPAVAESRWPLGIWEARVVPAGASREGLDGPGFRPLKGGCAAPGLRAGGFLRDHGIPWYKTLGELVCERGAVSRTTSETKRGSLINK